MLRAARPADAAAIAQVVVDSWRSTYPGMVPQDYLNSMNAGALEPRWRRRLDDAVFARLTFVVEVGDRLVGFATAGPERDGRDRFVGELYAIYLTRESQGLGWGRALVGAVADALVGAGLTAMVVWALRANRPARAFYERLGGTYLRERVLDFGAGFELIEVGYGWDEIQGRLTTASLGSPARS